MEDQLIKAELGLEIKEKRGKNVHAIAREKVITPVKFCMKGNDAFLKMAVETKLQLEDWFKSSKWTNEVPIL